MRMGVLMITKRLVDAIGTASGIDGVRAPPQILPTTILTVDDERESRIFGFVKFVIHVIQ